MNDAPPLDPSAPAPTPPTEPPFIRRASSEGILGRLVGEMNALKGRRNQWPPFKVEDGLLIIPPSEILSFLARCGCVVPVRSTKGFTEHLKRDRLLLERNRSRRIGGRRFKCVVMSLRRLKRYGIVWPVKEEVVDQGPASETSAARVKRAGDCFNSVAVLKCLACGIGNDEGEAAFPPFMVENDSLLIPPMMILDYLKRRGHGGLVTTSRRLVMDFHDDGFLIARNLNRTMAGRRYRCSMLSLERMKAAGVDWPTIGEKQ
ncbi:MAG: hypothetical protein HQL53_06210 [Magnetococcales bacterium]|nr:hypothetical protein [Magnetococcales bacterium]